MTLPLGNKSNNIINLSKGRPYVRAESDADKRSHPVVSSALLSVYN